MPNLKISEHTSIADIAVNDLLPIVDVSISTTRKTTVANLLNSDLLTPRFGQLGIGIGTFGYSEKFIVKGGVYNSAFVNADYIASSSGASLHLIFGAASGLTYMRLAALNLGGTTWGTLTLQDGGGAVIIGTTAIAGSEIFRCNGISRFDNAMYIVAPTAFQAISSSTTTNYVFTQYVNGGGSFYVGRDTSTGSGFGSGAYGSVVYSEGNYPLSFFTNTVERVRILGTGPVIIGTTTAAGSETLRVNGSVYVDLGITAASNIGVGTGYTSSVGVYIAGTTLQSGGAYQYGVLSGATMSGTTQSNDLYAGGSVKASTTVATYAGIRVDDAGLGSGAAITTNIGIYLAARANGTGNWSIYSNGSNSYHAGAIYIGSPTGVTGLEQLCLVNDSSADTGGLSLYNLNTAGYGSRITFHGAYHGGYSYCVLESENSSTGGQLKFYTADTSHVLQKRITIDEAGKVDITLLMQSPEYRVGAISGTYGGRLYRPASTYMYFGLPGTTASEYIYFLKNDGNGAFYIDAAGNIYGEGNCSFLTFTDRTPYPKDKVEAWAAVKSMESDGNGSVDHKKLHSFIKHSGKRHNAVTKEYEDYEARDMSATISVLVEALKDAENRLAKLENK